MSLCTVSKYIKQTKSNFFLYLKNSQPNQTKYGINSYHWLFILRVWLQTIKEFIRYYCPRWHTKYIHNTVAMTITDTPTHIHTHTCSVLLTISPIISFLILISCQTVISTPPQMKLAAGFVSGWKAGEALPPEPEHVFWHTSYCILWLW